MTIFPQSKAFIDDFFREISAAHSNNTNLTFSYLAVRKADNFYLVKGTLLYNTAPGNIPRTHVQTTNVRAGCYDLSEIATNSQTLVDELLSGQLGTPHGSLLFPANDAGSYGATLDLFHPDGLKAQSRYSVLAILGGSAESYLLQQPAFDWELRSIPAPFDSIQELAAEYRLGPLRNIFSVELIAFNGAAFDFSSTVNGTKAQLGVLLAHGLDPQEVTLGYRLFSQGRVERRASLAGREMEWTQKEEHQHGKIEIDVPTAAVLQCFVSYKGVTQHYGWVSDPATVQNSKRAVYQTFDPGLDVLKDFLTKSGKGRNAREFEVGVAWLLWMLGFSVAHLGGTDRTQEAADLLVTTPSGQFAVVECTTGLLKADNKLPLLFERTERVRRSVAESNNNHLRVLPVIVTSRSRAEIGADLEQAEKLGILVMSKENLEQAVTRTLILPNSEQIYAEGLQAVESAKAKYTTDTTQLGIAPLNGQMSNAFNGEN